ncbi:Aste57867_6932 [Aphanomyces stellatus]|uniref:Aste57867_6932 protein n=1 Tax=Aphanomyces stellatus TaxID=120398 RepID=A0A485KHY7_9STRA|nr:hypothetical protein As57867_006910 [Aphanomyces stellatus]VFT83884.1 Aste57867_6932 [Aphanomyces stellatus]
MRVISSVAALAAVALAADDVKILTFRTCRQTSYTTEGNQIFAVDPQNPAAKTPVKIKGVQWFGTESIDGIPNGLWGKGSVQTNSGLNGTSLADMLQFLYDNKFNTVRIPLNGENIVNNTNLPKVTNIHGENKEIALFDKGFVPKEADFIARFVGSFQKYRIGTILDLHFLTAEPFPQDANWYYPSYDEPKYTKAYQVAEYLATNFCKPAYWNIIGIDLKNAMTDVTWPASAKDGNPKNDWATAADAIAARVNELCPQWIVFVTGASTGDFVPTGSKSKYKIWPGLNFANATKRPLAAKNVVYSPQAFTQAFTIGDDYLPPQYFNNPSSNCSKALIGDKATECVTIQNGQKVPNTKKSLACENSKYVCNNYEPLAPADMTKIYQTLLDQNLGDVVKDAKVPVVFSSFGGIYGASQPVQTTVLDLLIKYIGANTAGGIYYSLNPDTQMWLEGPAVPNKTVGVAHYGLMSSTSWQVANADLLAALATLPTSDLPCYGDVQPGPVNVKSAAPAAASMAMAVLIAALALLV